MTAISRSTEPIRSETEQTASRSEYALIDGKPIVRMREFLKIVGVSRTRAYEKWNPKSPYWDPEFPVGFPLYDSPQSPRVFWVHEGFNWVQARSNQHRNQF